MITFMTSLSEEALDAGRAAAQLQLTHFALLVPDIERAIPEHEELLSVRFCAPHTSLFPRVDQYGGSGSAEVTMTYSQTRPGSPWVELLEATGDGLWSAGRGLGHHHVGGFATDFEATIARYDGSGLRREATIFRADGQPIIVFYTTPEPSPFRLEVLSPVLRPSWTEWVGGGDATPEHG